MNMNKVRITAIRQTVYEDLMARYEPKWIEEAKKNGKLIEI